MTNESAAQSAPKTPANPAPPIALGGDQEPAQPPQFPSLPKAPESFGAFPAAGNAGRSKLAPRNTAGNVLLEQSIQQLVNGPPLEVKIRQRVRVADKAMVGIGRYVQAGRGQGKYRSEMVMSLGDSRCTLLQVNDGHLAWSRQKTGNDLKVWRVNVLRLEELSPSLNPQAPQRLRVVGVAELLDALQRDYELELARGMLDGQAVHVARGELSEAARQRLLSARADAQTLPSYVPDHVIVVLSREATPVPLLPLRIEYWSGDPDPEAGELAKATRVGLLELTEAKALDQVDAANFEFSADRIPEYEDRTSVYATRYAMHGPVHRSTTRR